MKRLLAIVLCLCLVASLAMTAFAGDTGGSTTGGTTTGGSTTGGSTTGGSTTGGSTTGGSTTGGSTTGGSTTGGGETGGDEIDTPVVIIPSKPATPADPEDGVNVEDFTDIVVDSWYYDSVEWAVENGITEGTNAEGTTFSPTRVCTRAEMVTFLWRAAGEPKAAATTNAFTDVDTGAYYYDALLWAVGAGITNGTSATTFSPNKECTRSEMVTFLFRFAGKASDVTVPFTDIDVNAFYAEAVLWAYEHGITLGTSATTFSPVNGCSRAEMVTFLYRCCAE